MNINYVEQINFNKDCINLYFFELNNCEKSQKKPIWSKIINLLKENVELYKEIEEYKRRKLYFVDPESSSGWQSGISGWQGKSLWKQCKNPSVLSDISLQEGSEIDCYNNDEVRDDFDYDFELQYRQAERRF